MGITHALSGRGAALTPSEAAPDGSDLPVVALAGNPNVGKSTVFNALTGLRQHTGNWSGKTVALCHARCKAEPLTLVDLPGCYSLNPASPEEAVAREFLIKNAPAAVVVVVDATCLERSLALALAVLELTPRVVVCLNLIDEAKKRGLVIDSKLLSSRLGAPVLPCAARSGVGLDALIEAIAAEVRHDRGEADKRPQKAAEADAAADERAAVERLKKCAELLRGVVSSASDTDEKPDSLAKNGGAKRTAGLIDRIMTGRFTAFPVMLLMLLMVFYVTIIGANYPSQALGSAFGRMEELLRRLFEALHVAEWLTDALLAGVFRTVGWVVAVMLPPMAIFFPLFTLLEDLGYLPRAAFNLDRCFMRCGSCGKQAITMCMGFGCNAAGVVGCRIIPTESERLSAILTNSFVPCNGRFPIIIALVAIFFAGRQYGEAASGLGSLRAAGLLALIVGFSVLVTLLVTLLLSKTLFRGERSSFLMELPPYRPPLVGQVIIRSILDRTLHILGRAVVVAAPAGLIIYALANLQIGGTPLLSLFSGALDPFARFFGLDGVILAAFILGFPANELVLPIMLLAYTSGGSLAETGSYSELASLLYSNGWTAKTALCTVIFTLFHWPCSTTCLTIRKEAGGLKWLLLGIAVPTLTGLFILAAVNGLFHALGG